MRLPRLYNNFLFKKCERKVLNLIHTKHFSLWSFCFKPFLLIGSLLYLIGSYCHRKIYNLFPNKQVHCQTPVISIGNIAVGGSGKTPFLIRFLHDLAIHPCAVITRGYRAKKETNDVYEINTINPIYGDEPNLLKNSLPQDVVFVCKSKSKAAQRIDQRYPLIIIDDGLQHHRLHKNSNIIVIHADHINQKYLLPLGLLREPFSRIHQADLIVINHVHCEKNFQKLSLEMQKYAKCAIIGARMQLDQNCIENLRGKSIAVFCALGSPNSFLSTLREYVQIINTWILPDHSYFNEEKLRQFAMRAKKNGAEILVCSEKDALKLQEMDHFPLPIVCAYAELKVIYNISAYQAFLSKLQLNMRKI